MNKKILFSIIMIMVVLLLLSPSVNRAVYAAGNSNPDNVTISLEQLDQYASRTVYTVQTGSFMSRAEAQKQFDFIIQGLPRNDLDYLRIEKIGNYYTVRIGKFEDRVSVDNFLQTMKSKFPEAVRMKAYIKGDRITKMYRGSSVVDKHKTDKKVLADSKPQTTGLQNNDKSLHQRESEIYTIQTGSFMSGAEAQKQFNFIVQRLLKNDLDHLRIEKIGNYHTVRIGKFEDRVSADKFLQAMKSMFPAAVRLKAYIKSDRITKMYRDSSVVDKHKIDKKVLADSKPQKTRLQNNDKSLHQRESEIYTVQTGTFMNYVDAKKKYDAMVQGANTSDPVYNLSYLRIEKTAKTYSVRIGNFENYKTAKNFLETIKPGHPNALIIKDVIKDARIIKLYQR